MENKTLIDWEAGMTTIQALQEGVYPSLHVLDNAAWETSPYRNFEGDSELKDHYHSLVGDEPTEVSKVVQEASDADLAEIMHPTQKEIDTRQGLTLLECTRGQLDDLHKQVTRQLRRYQCVRDGAIEEMERRARIKIVENGGEHLDSFAARYILGPAVTPIMPYPHMPPSDINKPREREWIRARVKSGKTVYVDHLTFDIPDLYKKDVLAALKAAKLITENTSNHYYAYYSDAPPHQASQPIARFYYKMGFKPRSEITVHYYCHYYAGGWNNGWHLGRQRQMKTSELEPIE